MNMKQIDKLNEDFFDNFSNNELIDEPVDDLIYNPDYTYNIQFIIYRARNDKRRVLFPINIFPY